MAQENQKPSEGTCIAKIIVAPAHVLGETQMTNHIFQEGYQQIAGLLPLDLLFDINIIGTLKRLDDDGTLIRPLGTQESLPRLC